jgi:quinoprotein glucose dehydrogenase
MTTQTSPISTGIRRAYALILILIGAVLIAGGAELIMVGGSFYYLLAGLATAASGVLVWRGDRSGRRLYGAMLVATLAWAIWEAGWDGWALNARLLAPFVLGLGFILPPIARGLVRKEPRSHWAGWPGFAGGLTAATIVGGVAHGLVSTPPDPLYQAGTTAPPAETAAAGAADARASDWLHYGNDQGGTRYSALNQITPANVGQLQRAWTVHLGGLPNDGKEKLEVTPLKVGNSLFLCTGYSDMVSIDAETGKVNWRSKAGVNHEDVLSGTCRGVAYYEVPGATGACARRVITASVDGRLIAVDADDGKPCQDFGTNGQTSLMTGLGPSGPGYYMVTSAPAVVRGKLVLGGWVLDGQYWGEPSGVIRAYDARTGKFAWAFDVGRPDDHGEPPAGQHYTRSTPNSWAPMSADDALGLVYVPTGNSVPDYYGGMRRPFDDRYSSSVLALDAETGAVRWSFQTAHHDLWDHDVASQPTLVDIRGPHGLEHALIQPTKRGEIFVLDRRTGKPLRTVEERPVPQGGIAPGERLSPTQPFSTGLPSFRGADLRESDMWGVTPLDQLYCRILFKRARYDGPATPPGLTKPSVIFPGTMGGVDWGGVTIDRSRNLMFVISTRFAQYIQLIPRSVADARGLKPHTGKESAKHMIGALPQANTPYAADIGPFMGPLYTPCIKPPYGIFSAVDLTTGKLVWTRPIGTARDAGPLGIPLGLPITMGTPNLGGSVATRSGLVFIGATIDRTFRAIDARSGKELWSASLPGGGNATPLTYWSQSSQRQFVVIAAGGAALLGSKPSDAIAAYALPKTQH